MRALGTILNNENVTPSVSWAGPQLGLVCSNFKGQKWPHLFCAWNQELQDVPVREGKRLLFSGKISCRVLCLKKKTFVFNNHYKDYRGL